VAGYRTWQEEFDRHVTEGQIVGHLDGSPIISARSARNSPSYHENSDCDYDENTA